LSAPLITEPEPDGFFRALFEQHPQPMWVHDAETLDFLAVNDALCRTYGYAAGELLTMKVTMLHAAKNRPSARELESYFSNTRHHAWHHCHKEGTLVEVETISSIVQYEQRAARVVIVHDVTERNRAERAVREHRLRQHAPGSDASESICLVDVNSRLIYVGASVHQHFGYEPEDLVGTQAAALVHPDDRAAFLSMRGELLAEDGGSRTFECRLAAKNGEWRWIQGTATNMLADPGVSAIVLTYRDITSRRMAELAMRRGDEGDDESEQWVWSLDTEGRFTYCSGAIDVVLGYSADEVIGHFFYEYYFPESREKVQQFFRRLVASRSGWTDLVQRLAHRDGSECFVETTAEPMFDASGAITGFRGIDRNVTRSNRFEQRIRYESRRDSLTGLPNRIYFQERLGEALARAADERAHQTHESSPGAAARVAVLFIDLDHFKLLNDTFGHSVGDNALQVIASVLRSMIGSEDAVARVGGDELTLFIEGIHGVDDARRVARRVLDAISIPLTLDGRQIHVSASIGISLHPADGETSAVLVRNAEHAMHRAKELGRSTIQHFTPAMKELHAKRLALEFDLHAALSRHELVLHYQPLYDVKTWLPVGVEALIRWQHPTRGLLLPDDFIEVAEKSGLIVPVGAWVLRQACADLRRWRDDGHDVRVAVNLSARQLQEPELIATIRETLQRERLDPRLLELEITETVAMQNAEATLATLRELKEMGVSLAVDDFGTGYSSLLYLTRFPIDTVKIDRQFVGNVTTDENDAQVVGAVVALAHSLGLKSVGEGVETEQQRQFLARHRCTEMQGYLFSRPVPAEQIDSLFREPALTAHES
jgi:diguanylate cyclase (GGDEF)-like protein/PAS domain S-box-containing protein